MKRRKLKRKKIGINCLILTFIIALFSISVGYSLLSESLKVVGNATLVEQTNSDMNIDLSYVKNVWGSNPYTIQYDITIKNISEEINDGWKIYIDVPLGTKIVNCWNVECLIQDGKLIFENTSYNGNFSIDSEIAFGIQITSSEILELNEQYFEKIEQDTKETIVDSNQLSVTNSQTGKWQDENGTHISYEMTIKNNSEDYLTNWRVEIEKGELVTLETAWNANYIEKEDIIIFANTSYNGNLSPQSTVTFGFIINTKTEERLGKISLSATK